PMQGAPRLEPQSSPRRRRMRHSLPAALVAILFSVTAAAQDDEGEETAEGEEGAAGSLADGPDPVDEETSDDGRFAPKGKTGKLKEDKRRKQEEETIEEIPRKKINAFLDLLAVWGLPPDPDHQPVEGNGEVTAYGLVAGGT